MAVCIRPAGDILLLDIKVQPGASRSALGGIRDGRLKVRIAAAPEDGKANGELVSFLAALLRCPKRDIAIKSGERSRHKTLSLPIAYLEKIEEIVKNEE
ncbi:MAG: DUF167 domain-containing protein [Treponema sp.]|jgi:uncharacterized protein (TIGR00251 family)|nr:DUF167 domain-containing protein [Treponema sp.]